MSAPLVIATELPGTSGGVATAAASAVAAAGIGGHAGAGVLFAELGGERRRGPTMLAAEGARRLEDALRHRGHAAAARGGVCWLCLPDGEAGIAELRDALAGSNGAPVFAHMGPGSWRGALDDPALSVHAGLLRADLPDQRSLAALVATELRAEGMRVKVAPRPPGAVASRRAVAGLDPGGRTGERARRLARGLLGDDLLRRAGRRAGDAGSQRGQALPLVLGAALLVIVVALLLAAIGGAVTGTARAQRVADLAALSAARSMRDDYDRLFVPARFPDGRIDPRHLERERYLERAARAAREAGRRNGGDPSRMTVTFPDRDSFAPLRARVDLVAELEPSTALDRGQGSVAPVEASAEASVTPPGSDPPSPPSDVASGGGYSGPLARRQGQPMRPDVARAFDRLSAAADRAGHALLIASAYRSDAEQAELYARNPDPKWVAPPGRSLHRCATELDLGPSGAYAWLAANAHRFGFVRRYSWEPWHFGFERGPAPCSTLVNGSRHGDGSSAPDRLPAYVPARYRTPIARAATRWNVSAALLAAQLLAESNFNPHAVSPAGARGIAQFMPGTAAAYGLRDPFDANAAINAQARLMSALLRRFESVALALAAYNAGPGAVAACECVPPYPETEAYVARILGLLGGAGELSAPELEVRLVQ